MTREQELPKALARLISISSDFLFASTLVCFLLEEWARQTKR